MTNDEDDALHVVVRNDEEQYSIWPADEPPPAGWHVAGPTGPTARCLAHIEEVWTDMRPLSLRRAMDEAG
ncbi:MbtH family NRPS accessory protein [Micromonospora sp. NPDC048999]|uniref:MbtH family protein n=1 Tax=Micromonospora sp. NPDC048999 TaxID=3155391 RepID=UPI0033D6B736